MRRVLDAWVLACYIGRGDREGRYLKPGEFARAVIAFPRCLIEVL